LRAPLSVVGKEIVAFCFCMERSSHTNARSPYLSGSLAEIGCGSIGRHELHEFVKFVAGFYFEIESSEAKQSLRERHKWRKPSVYRACRIDVDRTRNINSLDPSGSGERQRGPGTNACPGADLSRGSLSRHSLTAKRAGNYESSVRRKGRCYLPEFVAIFTTYNRMALR